MSNASPAPHPGPLAAAFALADGRLPAGGYAHSGGLEPALYHRDIVSQDDVSAFIRARAHTIGLMAASFAVAAWYACDTSSSPAARDAVLAELDAQLKARTPLPTLRRITAELGRLLQRSMQSISPGSGIDSLPTGLQQPIVFGAVAQRLGLTARHTAQVVLHDTVSVPASAAVKLLHGSPFDAYRPLFDLTGELDALAERAVREGQGPAHDLPAPATPLADIAALAHQKHHDRLFAS